MDIEKKATIENCIRNIRYQLDWLEERILKDRRGD
jgi:hypothetical protein